MSPQFSCFALRGEIADEAGAEVFACDGPAVEGTLAALAGVVLPVECEARAVALLEAGAARVFVGEAAIRDSGVIGRLAGRFGSARIGVYVAARRMEVAWSFETVSNADFKGVTPSICEPCWEILRADGSRSGIRAPWWLGEMIKLGAAAALLRVDIVDDTDLNLCAGLVEDLGERLWLGPLDHAEPALADWVAYGRLERIVLPPALFSRRAELMPVAEIEMEPVTRMELT